MNDELNDNDKSPQKQGLNKDFLDNQWKPGQSGNPGGKPQGKSITASLRKLIEEGTNADDMAKVLYNLAQAGGRSQVEALKELLNRTDGKVLDTHRIEGDVPVTIVYKLKESKDATE